MSENKINEKVLTKDELQRLSDYSYRHKSVNKPLPSDVVVPDKETKSKEGDKNS